MGPVAAEGDVRVWVAFDVELERVVEDRLVAVAGRVEQDDLLALSDDCLLYTSDAADEN